MKNTNTLTILATCFLGFLPLQAQETLDSFLPANLETTKGEAVPKDQLKGKIVALYFSAHRCAPCRLFTPSLVKFHKENKDKNFEVIFVSFDDTSEEKATYIGETGMEFLTVPGSKADAQFKLANQYGVNMLPRLIVFGTNGAEIVNDAKDEVSRNAAGALERWKNVKS